VRIAWRICAKPSLSVLDHRREESFRSIPPNAEKELVRSWMKLDRLLRHLRQFGCVLRREGKEHALWKILRRDMRRLFRAIGRSRICSLRGFVEDCRFRSAGVKERRYADLSTIGRVMFREKFPRLYELKDRTPDPESPSAYFKDFEIKLKTSPLAWAWFTCLEENYNTYRSVNGRRSRGSIRYLMVEDADRGWAQLFDILCEVDAFIHLMECGCSDITSYPEPQEGQQDPDSKASLVRKGSCAR